MALNRNEVELYVKYEMLKSSSEQAEKSPALLTNSHHRLTEQ